MSEKKLKVSKTAEVSEEKELSVEELQKQIQELKAKKLQSFAEKIEKISDEEKIQIGIQLDVQKVADIIAFMLANNKQKISLKFEVWENNE
jgi:ATP-dependent RNA circularization protein (DNA/RNA ligase family)